MKTFLFSLGFVLCLLPGLGQAEPRRIVLQDGTQIVGELLSLKNGSYTIRSKTLGTITVSERQVASVSSLNQSVSGSNPIGSNPIGSNPIDSARSAMQGNQLQSIQQNLLNDSGMVQRIMQLQSNPDMQAVLSDPDVMSAVRNLDFEALKNHPKIQKLMRNRDVQAISQSAN